MAKVIIGCRLPNGIILEHPTNPKKKVELAGLNKTTIIGATYAQTDVDSEFWEAWLAANREFAPLVNGAIFFAKNADEAQSKAKDVAKESTGFEPMAQNDDKRARGVKKAA